MIVPINLFLVLKEEGINLETYVMKAMRTAFLTDSFVDIDHFAEATSKVFRVPKEEILKMIGRFTFEKPKELEK